MYRITFRILLLLIISVLSINQTYAQADSALVEVADEMYNFGDKKDALDVYKSAIASNPNNVRANFMAGICYLETINKANSLKYFQKAYALQPDVSPKMLYYIGYAYHLGYDFDNAIDQYNLYIDSLGQKEFGGLSNKDRKTEKAIALKRIEECKTGKYLVNNPQKDVKIQNLGKTLNTTYPEYGPVITPDEKFLFFTSKRKGSTGGKKDRDNEYFEDIYFCENTAKGWTEPKPLDSIVNTELHESCIGVSPDGKNIFLYKDNDNFKGDIFHSSFENKNWSQPEPLNIIINTEFIENSMSLSADGQTLFFSSDKPGGIGGKDIYFSQKKKNGNWEYPQNLGYDINTEYDEEGPFLAADGKTMYFSSKGHKGMGGYDLFKTVYDSSGNKWSKPENLGFPINSTDDDIYFVISGDGKYGYYASVKENSFGNLDLYRILMPGFSELDTFLVVNEDSAQQVIDTTTKAIAKAQVELKLKIIDKEKGELTSAHVEIFTENGEYLFNGEVEDGQLSVSIGNDISRKVIVALNKENFVFKTTTLRLPIPEEDKQIVEKTIFVDKIAIGVRTILKNIYFDFDMATLKSSSDKELDKLRKLLVENPDMKIQLDGHTDNIGSPQYNKELSLKRAQAVVDWLIKHGISPDRLSAKGFGQEVPLASNDDEEEGRELNRRTEFVILEN